MRIFLTGASGYIGLHILQDLLATGHEVTAVVRSSAKLGHFADDPSLHIVTADLAQPDFIPGVIQGHQVCVHAALLWNEPGSELELRDTAATARLFDAAGRAGVARSIYLSSVAVHRPFSDVMSEDERLSATDYYGATKGAGELFLRAACADHDMAGIVLRPELVVGPPAFEGGAFRSDRRLLNMVAAAQEARPLDVATGDGRQFSDIAMVSRVINLLARADEHHATYFCMDHAILSWEWIARKVVACLRSSSEVRLMPAVHNGSVPRFCTDRLDELLGEPSDARNALDAHIFHLAKLSSARTA